MKKATNFTFKTEKPTGKWRSFDKPSHKIKIEGKECGTIDSDSFTIRLQVMRTAAEKLANPTDPCEWRWAVLNKVSKSLDEAKAWLNDSIEYIQNKYTLYKNE